MALNLEEGGSSHLEQFCLLAKTAKGRACVALIQQVLNNPKMFVFGELLGMENVASLAATEHEPYLLLLKIFCYGTLSEYQQGSANLPELTPQQKTKLRQLSIISLAQKNKIVPYSLLQKELEINNIRELEDVIIESIYSGLIKGKLNQKEGVLKVNSCISRDVKLEQVDEMLLKLNDWRSMTEGMLKRLDECVEHANNLSKEEEKRAATINEKVAILKKEVKTANMGGCPDNFEEMEVDKPKKSGNRSKRGYAAALFDQLSRGAK
mmetsp:Transcript_35705/g.47101  ORF Transcript_35705/g.47101 Transcript_35705/m.47101 type:complete len:266 (+) Transcript_35705:120-917(+)|eukprot:CAMPEP_0117752512 /NCGR_PEP_ID=MMETSP0947-20121206/11649_1 /TAXON_ID=44440 /ORGANISM="Chattonella subsalsa, Strain CCMP2191" /LENGTH=265 /DNA_ID=CAMNT_0005571167 /DNA_START=111 /DNA_END=908 /DNA_ORIENTATION=+